MPVEIDREASYARGAISRPMQAYGAFMPVPPRFNCAGELQARKPAAASAQLVITVTLTNRPRSLSPRQRRWNEWPVPWSRSHGARHAM
jgi:hypothetical protein